MNIFIGAEIEGEGWGNLYPTHIFDWKFKGVNCPTEDYSVGNISDFELTFTTDVKIERNAFLSLNNNMQNSWLFRVSKVERIDNSDRYNVTCYSQYSFGPGYSTEEYDAIIPDSTLATWAASTMTLAQLDSALEFYDTVDINSNYVINSGFGYSGVTKRQVLRWIHQLDGSNIAGRQGSEYGDWNHTIKYLGLGVRLYLTNNNVKNIKLAEYTTPAIDKVWFGNDNSDVGLGYGTGDQQLTIPSNPLINYEDTSFLQPLYNKVHDSGRSYTPMKVQLFWDEEYPVEPELNPDPNPENWPVFVFGNKTFPQIINFLSYQGPYPYYFDGTNYYTGRVFNYELSPSGITIECTGSYDRRETNAYLGSEIQNAGKWNKFTRTLDATISEVGNIDGRVSTLTQTVDGITTTVAGKVDKNSAISTDTIYYLATNLSSGVTTSTAGWTTTPQNMTASNNYLWTYHKYTYADNHTSDTTPVITGRYGEDGSGRGITSITSLYYAKANSTAPSAPTAHVTSTSTSGGQWTIAVPTLSNSFPYMFTCDEILYTDNTYGWSAVVQNSALTTFNSQISQQADKIALVVTENQGVNEVNAASIVAGINGATSTVAISADHINLNGAVTANNNVTIGVDGVISAVGASLTNANIVGGTVRIQTALDSNSAIRLTGPTGTYGSTSASMSPNGIDLWYYPSATKTNWNAHDGQQSEWQQMDSSIDRKQYAIATNTGFAHKNYDGLRFDLSANSLKFQNSAGTNTLQIYNSGAINVANKYRLGYYGSVGDNNGGFFELYKGGSETNPAISIDGHLQQFVIMDTSTGRIRALLDATGLFFYDANGNALNSYPAVNPQSAYFRITSGSYNVRSSPDSSGTGNILVTLHGGDELPYLGVYDADWSMVSYNGQTAYIVTYCGTVVYH